ncbi:ARF GAP-like zinc finger-containing protein [Mycena kentingensis (nom. inval.)]|nr:ARF GAP-like zinc finger-containing protein [Mycena kentingensis (nom. inval.)]
MSVNKLQADRNQKLLLDLVSLPGNDTCADCKAKHPRWASYSLGIFICVNCASIHRKIGVHVTKVKSLTMDSWTKEQVDRMREMGNANSNAIYNSNEARHPPPVNLLDGERDSEMEQYVRSKYEYKRFVDRSALVAAKLGRSRTAPRSRGVSPSPAAAASSSNPLPPRSNTTAPEPPKAAPPRSFTHPSSAPASAPPPPQPQRPPQQSAPSQPQQQPGGVWNDLISLQTPSMNSSLPLQLQANPPPPFLQQQPQQPLMTGYQPQMQMVPAPTGMLGMGMGMGGGMGMGMGSPAPPQFATSFVPQGMPMQQQQLGVGVASPAPMLYNPQSQPFAGATATQTPPIQQPIFGSPAPMGQMSASPVPVPMHTPSPGIGMAPQMQMQQPPFMQQQPQPQIMVPQQQQQQFGMGLGTGMGPGQQQFAPSVGMPQMGMGMMPTGQPWMGGNAPMGYMPQQQTQGQWGAM